MLSSASFVDTGVQIEYKYNFDKLLQTKNKICKFVKNMVNNITEKPQNVFDKWDSYFKQDLKYEEWVESLCNMYKCNKSIELQHFHFKMLHQTLANNETLFKWNLVESDLCTFCNEEIETLYHTYLECEVSKTFWNGIETYIYRRLNIRIPITNKQIIFGCSDRSLSSFNTIYLLAKKYLYECRCRNTFPTIQNYTQKLEKYIEMEQGVYVLNDQLSVFLDRWGETV